MKYRIDEWFSESKYKKFVDYCRKNNIQLVSELEDFDFSLLFTSTRIGELRVEKIKERYNEYKKISPSLTTNDNEDKEIIDIKYPLKITAENLNFLPLYSNIKRHKQDFILDNSLKWDHKISTLLLKIRTEHVLQIFKIDTIGECLFYTPDELIKIKNCGKATIADLQNSFREYILFSDEDVSGHWVDFDSMINSLIPLKTRHLDIIKIRLGLSQSRINSLQAVGQKCGLTRERVRQIILTIVRKLRTKEIESKLEPFWKIVNSVLERYIGFASFNTVSPEINQLLHWEKALPSHSLAMFLSIYDKYEIDQEFDFIGLKNNRCNHCDKIYSFLIDLTNKQETVSKTEVLNYLKNRCENLKCPHYENNKSFDFSYIQHIIDSKNTDKSPISYDNEYIHSYSFWLKENKTLFDEIAEILKNYGKSIHFTELKKITESKIDEELNKHRFLSILNRDPNALLWGRGIYIHRANIKVPIDFIENVHKQLEEKLISGLPVVCITGFFYRKKGKFVKNNVPYPTALYTSLREYKSETLAFPYYPAVFLKKNDIIIKPLSEIVEDYLFEIGKAISRSDFNDYFKKEIGMQSNSLQQIVSNSENIVRLPNKFISHKKYVKD